MPKKKKSSAGRPRVGQPISITLTDEQREYVDSQIEPGGTRTQVIRRWVQEKVDAAKKRKKGG